MASIKFTYEVNDKIAQHYDTPSEHVVSEGELLIKALAEKQTNKFVNLKEQLTQKKEFHTSTFVPITAFTSGQNTLKEFKESAEFINSIEDLKSLGLTQNEIELFVDSRHGEEFIYYKHKNICKTILQEQLQDLHTKLENLKAVRRNTVNKNDEAIPRHMKDLALSVKPESEETKLYKFALSCSSSKAKDNFSHPINNLKTIERELFGHLDAVPVPPLKKRRKKAKKYLEHLELSDDNESVTLKEKSSKWDLKEKPREMYFKQKEIKTYTCKPQQFYTIKNNQIVTLNDLKVEEMKTGITGKEFVAGNRTNSVENFEKLSEDDIRKIPRFQDYQHGIPSKKLYIKNLAKGVKEEDLVKLFNQFDTEDEKIVYRLLTGKMRGQAFVTLHNINQATKCLQALNGVVIKGKPIVIQYGTHKS